MSDLSLVRCQVRFGAHKNDLVLTGSAFQVSQVQIMIAWLYWLPCLSLPGATWAGFIWRLSTWMSVGVRFFFESAAFQPENSYHCVEVTFLALRSPLWKSNAGSKPIFSFRGDQQRAHLLKPRGAQVPGWHRHGQGHLESLRHQEFIERLRAL